MRRKMLCLGQAQKHLQVSGEEFCLKKEPELSYSSPSPPLQYFPAHQAHLSSYCNFQSQVGAHTFIDVAGNEDFRQ